MEKYTSHGEHESEIIEIQANIDDMNPELFPHVLDCLFDAGVRDAYLIPIIMKKGRPGILLNVLLDEEILETIETIIFQETTTLGLRYFRGNCLRLERSFEKVETPWGDINVKISYRKGKLTNVKPEYQECQKMAQGNNIPLKKVYAVVNAGINSLQKTWEK